MQANLVKSLYLAFVSLICFFSDRSTTIRIYYFILFNARRCALICVLIDHMYALLVWNSMKLTGLKVNNMHTFVHWLNGNVIH